MDRSDPDSTLVRRGQNALSYSDMVAFAESVETRSLSTLLEELPGIARLSDTKYFIR